MRINEFLKRNGQARLDQIQVKRHTYNQSTQIPWENDVEYKMSCPDKMKTYIWFLHHHHGKPYKELLEVFPEYLKTKES